MFFLYFSNQGKRLCIKIGKNGCRYLILPRQVIPTEDMVEGLNTFSCDMTFINKNGQDINLLFEVHEYQFGCLQPDFIEYDILEPEFIENNQRQPEY